MQCVCLCSQNASMLVHVLSTAAYAVCLFDLSTLVLSTDAYVCLCSHNASMLVLSTAAYAVCLCLTTSGR